MKIKFKKIKTEHHILEEFFGVLKEIENLDIIDKIIPGRIERQQKGSSQMRFRISYSTDSGFKCIMSKGATAQELFIICNNDQKEILKQKIIEIIIKYPEIIFNKQKT